MGNLINYIAEYFTGLSDWADNGECREYEDVSEEYANESAKEIIDVVLKDFCKYLQETGSEINQSDIDDYYEIREC